MRRALALAALGRGTAAPNPLVGAVVVRGGRVLGQGFHRRPGESHAETMALAQAGEASRGATLYTNLEPCCHTGRTPPCVDQILRRDIARVVASMRDPNPRVNGGGFRTLRAAGVRVEVGLLRDEAFSLNAAFMKRTRRGLPLVTVKGAVSLDGRIATKTGHSKWITSASARRHARLLRLEHDAVMVGIGTALADDPRLNRRPRIAGARPLLRVVMDSSLRLRCDSRLVSSREDGPVLVLCSKSASERRRRRLASAGVRVESLNRRSDGLDLGEALRLLGSLGVSRLLVEGGGELHASFLSRGLADRLVLYVAPLLIGGRDSRPLVAGTGVRLVEDGRLVDDVRCSRVGDGWLVEGRLRGG
jgi:diaminohydroxyphosphoribosylaminopyrimidine deaminase/5-amino-6-(5-phosphoribosylamino)uracil reductase